MINRIKTIIKTGEKINVEFKAAQKGIPNSVYDTVCSFLNTKGGEILLGVDDNRNIIGIPPEKIAKYKKDFVSELNNPEKIFPTVYLNIEEYTINKKKVLYINVPEDSHVYKCANKIFLRNYEGDYNITKNQNLVTNLFIRKSSTYTENQVFPYMTIDDLNQDIINKVRQMAVNRTKNHPWGTLNNFELLKSASLYRKDFSTQQEGFTLACALLFGKDITIQSILPHYRTDLIFKNDNDIRYNDRDIVETNLIDSYDRIMRFVEKHLPSPFYLEKDVRIDVRNAIFRELAVNTLMHREYTMHNYARFMIEKDKIYIENANKPYICGNLKPDNFRPYTKNPSIAKIFKEIGYAEELGSGVRNIMKYSKTYFGSEPEFVDEALFTTTIKITNNNFIKHITSQVKENKNKISDQDSYQVSDQDKILKVNDNKEIPKNKTLSDQDSYQVSYQDNNRVSDQDSDQDKALKVNDNKEIRKNKKNSNQVSYQDNLRKIVISYCKIPRSLTEILEKTGYSSRVYFKNNVLNPLIENGYIKLTVPDKPTSKNQKYYTD